MESNTEKIENAKLVFAKHGWSIDLEGITACHKWFTPWSDPTDAWFELFDAKNILSSIISNQIELFPTLSTKRLTFMQIGWD